MQNLEHSHKLDFDNVVQEAEIRARKIELQIKDQERDQQKMSINETYLKHKIKDLETKIINDKNEMNETYKQKYVSLELDKNNYKNDLDVKSFQIAQLNQEKISLESKASLLQQELNFCKQSNQDLEKENKLLIEEILNAKQMKKSNLKKSHEPQRIQFKDKKSDKFIFDKIELDESEQQSDDMPESMVQFFKNSPSKFVQQKLSPKNTLKQSQQFIQKINSLEKDNENYKIVIDNLVAEMDQVNSKCQDLIKDLTNKNDDVQMLRIKINDLQQDNLQLREQILFNKQDKNFMTFNQNQQNQQDQQDQQDQQNQQDQKDIQDKLQQDIDDKNNQIQELQQKLQKYEKRHQIYKDEIQKIKNEKNKLIQISSDLKQQLIQNENNQDLKSTENKEQNDIIQKQLSQYKQLDQIKNQNLKSLQNSIRPNKEQNFELKKDAIDLDVTAVKESLSTFNEKLIDIKQEIKKEVIVQPKSLILQQNNSPQVKKASEKTLMSQKIAQERMKLNKKQDSGIANYNALKAQI